MNSFKLNIADEFSPLKSVVVCFGDNLPVYRKYINDDPEFTKYHPYPWDNEIFLKQQETFFKRLEKYGVKLVFPQTHEDLIWQAYTRDTGFVIGNKLYYSKIRKFKSRNGEVDKLLNCLNLDKESLVPLNHEIEGGDVLIRNNSSVYVGNGSRTSEEAVEELKQYASVQSFELGDNVMHLDTRLTILPKNIALTYLDAFSNKDQEYILGKYKVIEVTKEEAKRLGTNVFFVNPETVFVPKEHKRIAEKLRENKFNVEIVDYSEPINLGGSFRCTTLPLERS